METTAVTITITPSAEFLNDVLITAVEGGIGYWCSLSEYRHSTPVAYAVVDEVYESEDDEYATLPATVTATDLASGIARIASGATSLSPWGMGVVASALAADDAGEIDADAADWIFQATLLGDVIFG